MLAILQKKKISEKKEYDIIYRDVKKNVMLFDTKNVNDFIQII